MRIYYEKIGSFPQLEWMRDILLDDDIFISKSIPDSIRPDDLRFAAEHFYGLCSSDFDSTFSLIDTMRSLDQELKVV